MRMSATRQLRIGELRQSGPTHRKVRLRPPNGWATRHGWVGTRAVGAIEGWVGFEMSEGRPKWHRVARIAGGWALVVCRRAGMPASDCARHSVSAGWAGPAGGGLPMGAAVAGLGKGARGAASWQSVIPIPEADAGLDFQENHLRQLLNEESADTKVRAVLFEEIGLYRFSPYCRIGENYSFRKAEASKKRTTLHRQFCRAEWFASVVRSPGLIRPVGRWTSARLRPAA